MMDFVGLIARKGTASQQVTYSVERMTSLGGGCVGLRRKNLIGACH